MQYKTLPPWGGQGNTQNLELMNLKCVTYEQPIAFSLSYDANWLSIVSWW